MQQQSFRVLLVEDDDSLRVCLGEFLADHGWNVPILQELVKLQAQMTNNIPAFFMPAIVEALSERSAPQVEAMRRAFAGRARLVADVVSGKLDVRSAATLLDEAQEAALETDDALEVEDPDEADLDAEEALEEA